MTSPDSLSLVMVGLALYLTLGTLIYGISSFSGILKPSLLLLFCVSACMAALAKSWFGFVIWAELVSISLALLMAFTNHVSAKLYLYVQLAAGGILLFGTSLISTPFISAPLGPVPGKVIFLFLIALGIKSTFPFLHFWIPRIYEDAPVDALLLSSYAATMGIYGLLRLIEGPSQELMITGVIMALYGAFQALLQSNPRRMLAYSTMSQLGFAVTALATGTSSGRQGAIFFAVIHVLSKTLLFCSTEKIPKAWSIKKIFDNFPTYQGRFFFLIGALSMAGFPGTGGYMAKKAIQAALVSPLALGALHLAGVGTMLYLCKLGNKVFFNTSFLESSSGESTTRRNSSGFSLTFTASMFFFGIPLLFLGTSPGSAIFLGLSQKTSLSWNSLVLPPILLGGSLGIFALIRRIPGFQECSFPDMDVLAYQICLIGKPGIQNLRKIHSGKLRLHFLVFAFALLGIFLLFSLQAH